MGQTLSTPDVEKHIKTGADGRFLYGLCEMQGWRISMEDAHAIELNLDSSSPESNAYFAVYDGHGGANIARFAGDNVHKRLVNEEAYRKQQWEDALRRAFLGTDEDIRADTRFFRDPSGCTAVAALVTNDGRIFVANAGDSRSVISVKGKVKPLSHDHKPMNEVELSRIKNAGGYVEYGRVNGNLALSRAIGDFEFKKNTLLPPEEQMITANPDIIEHRVTEEDEFLVLACDGIWDCLSSQQVVDIVRLLIAQRKELSEIGEFICDHCVAPDTTSAGAGVGCDNMTIMIVGLLNGRTKEEWYDWIADRVEKGYGYDTPKEVPELYAPHRVSRFRAQLQAQEERARDRASAGNTGEGGRDNDSGFVGVFGGKGVAGPTTALDIARAMLSSGLPLRAGLGEDGSIMFANDEDSEDESEDDIDLNAVSDSAKTPLSYLTAYALNGPDVTKSLKAQLDELEENDTGSRIEQLSDDEVDMDTPHNKDSDHDLDIIYSDPGDEAQQAFGAQTTTTNGISSTSTGEAPPPPTTLVNGDIKVKQLNHLPEGDEASPAVKADGLMDVSESPLSG